MKIVMYDNNDKEVCVISKNDNGLVIQTQETMMPIFEEVVDAMLAETIAKLLNDKYSNSAYPKEWIATQIWRK